MTRQAASSIARLMTVALISLIMHAGSVDAQTAENSRWLVYYSDEAEFTEFQDYSLLVLDSEFHPPLLPLADRGKTLLGYISIGEVEHFRPHFEDVKADGILLQENKYWKGSYFVDLRDPRWTSRVIEELVPEVLRKGFHGLFLDTIDNPIYLEESEPERFKGMIAAAADLIRTIRYHYPRIKIMLNRGYALLPDIGGDIDYVLGESVYADYSFEDDVYGLVEHETYRYQVDMLAEAKARNPGLRIMTLDYWDPADTDGIREIYEEQRDNGFEPYVSTIELNKIIPEPEE